MAWSYLIMVVTILTFHSVTYGDECSEYCTCIKVGRRMALRCENQNLTASNVKEIAEKLEKNVFLTYVSFKGNLIEVFPMESFPKSKVLQRINLSANKLKRIPEHLKAKMPSLRSLALSNNKISEINDELNGLSQLVYLSLSNNQINKISVNSFKGLKDMQRLDLSTNKITALLPGTFKVFRNVVVDLSHNKLVRISNGVFSNSHIRKLILTNNRIEQLESESFSNVVIQEGIYLDQNRIKKLPNAFRNSNLSSLNLNKNPLLCDCTLFKTVKMITDENRILKLVNALCMAPETMLGINLANATALKSACQPCDFHNCPFRNSVCKIKNDTNVSCVCETGFAGDKCEVMEKERRVELTPLDRICHFLCTCKHGNSLVIKCEGKELTSENVSAIAKNIPPIISYLSFRKNFIQYFPTNDFFILQNLTVLDLSENILSTVPTRLEVIAPSLKTLVLANNTISALTNNVFGKVDLMHSIDLSNNNIVEISPYSLNGLKNLQELNLSSNKITLLPFGVFNAPLNAAFIDLSNNKLKSISNRVFSNRRIQNIILTNNHIDHLEENAFSNILIQHSIHLNKNKIRLIPTDIFQNSNLSFLNLAGNPLSCDCSFCKVVKSLIYASVRVLLDKPKCFFFWKHSDFVTRNNTSANTCCIPCGNQSCRNANSSAETTNHNITTSSCASLSFKSDYNVELVWVLLIGGFCTVFFISITATIQCYLCQKGRKAKKYIVTMQVMKKCPREGYAINRFRKRSENLGYV